jgi:tRNA(adenine34) deaminase
MHRERDFLARAVELALEAEREGNLPIGAVIALDDGIIAEGASAIIAPAFHPGRHAEMEALRAVPVDSWSRRRDMTCYTTLEPCVMCFGTLLLHEIGRVVYGARDVRGGAVRMLDHLPSFYEESAVPDFSGPAWPEVCDPLYERAAVIFVAESKRS